MKEIDPEAKGKHLMIPEVGQQPAGPGIRWPLWFGVVIIIVAVIFIVWVLGDPTNFPPQ